MSNAFGEIQRGSIQRREFNGNVYLERRSMYRDTVSGSGFTRTFTVNPKFSTQPNYGKGLLAERIANANRGPYDHNEVATNVALSLRMDNNSNAVEKMNEQHYNMLYSYLVTMFASRWNKVVRLWASNMHYLRKKEARNPATWVEDGLSVFEWCEVVALYRPSQHEILARPWIAAERFIARRGSGMWVSDEYGNISVSRVMPDQRWASQETRSGIVNLLNSMDTESKNYPLVRDYLRYKAGMYSI